MDSTPPPSTVKSLRSQIPRVYLQDGGSFTGSSQSSSSRSADKLSDTLSMLSLSSQTSTKSYIEGAIGSLTGRALARFGEFVLNPLENTLIRREFKKLISFLDGLDGVEKEELDDHFDWHKFRSRVFEAARPLYPKDIRLLAHIVFDRFTWRRSTTLAFQMPPSYFRSQPEFYYILKEHLDYLLQIYTPAAVWYIIRQSAQATHFVCACSHSLLLREDSGSHLTAIEDDQRKFFLAFEQMNAEEQGQLLQSVDAKNVLSLDAKTILRHVTNATSRIYSPDVRFLAHKFIAQHIWYPDGFLKSRSKSAFTSSRFQCHGDYYDFIDDHLMYLVDVHKGEGTVKLLKEARYLSRFMDAIIDAATAGRPPMQAARQLMPYLPLKNVLILMELRVNAISTSREEFNDELFKRLLELVKSHDTNTLVKDVESIIGAQTLLSRLLEVLLLEDHSTFSKHSTVTQDYAIQTLCLLLDQHPILARHAEISLSRLNRQHRDNCTLMNYLPHRALPPAGADILQMFERFLPRELFLDELVKSLSSKGSRHHDTAQNICYFHLTRLTEWNRDDFVIRGVFLSQAVVKPNASVRTFLFREMERVIEDIFASTKIESSAKLDLLWNRTFYEQLEDGARNDTRDTHDTGTRHSALNILFLLSEHRQVPNEISEMSLKALRELQILGRKR